MLASNIRFTALIATVLQRNDVGTGGPSIHKPTPRTSSS